MCSGSVPVIAAMNFSYVAGYLLWANPQVLESKITNDALVDYFEPE
jgi:hypothetical protein